MAKDTKVSLRQSVIYQVYNRNHNKSGTFRELIGDLKRIKELGVDILYLLPIHPIGNKDKKGTLGCPYSIRDYREINPEYGTIEDFKVILREGADKISVNSAAIMNPFSVEMMKSYYTYKALKGMDENCASYIEKAAEFLSTLKNLDRVDLMNYHTFGVVKYAQIGKKYELELTPLSPERLDEICAIFARHSIRTQIGG